MEEIAILVQRVSILVIKSMIWGLVLLYVPSERGVVLLVLLVGVILIEIELLRHLAFQVYKKCLSDYY